MKVNLVLHDFCKGWIIEKMADRLCEALNDIGVNAVVANSTSVHCDVNHFMIFHYVEVQADTRNTMLITHVDDILKVDMLRAHFDAGVDLGICMSSHTVQQLVAEGLPSAKLAFALPASDCLVTPRRITVGITSNAYSDGRKREHLLSRLCSEISLDDFEFQIFGCGWEKVAIQLEAAGAIVKAFPGTGDYRGDYRKILEAVPYFDYYLYLGLDEGALGTLDALAAGIPTIVTRQGYHIDIPDGITYGFWDYEELKEIFLKICVERHRRLDGVKSLTWKQYAARHVDLWSSLCAGSDVDLNDPRSNASTTGARTMPIMGYKSVLFNRYRRQMWARYWLPKFRRRITFLRNRVFGQKQNSDRV